MTPIAAPLSPPPSPNLSHHGDSAFRSQRATPSRANLCKGRRLEAADAESGVAALAGLIRYILNISQTDPDAAVELCKQLGPKLEEAAMTGAEILRRRGFEQGKSEGRAEGRAELLIRQLEVKFGALGSDQKARIQALSAEQLDRCAERVLTAGSFDEVVGAAG